MQWKVVSMAYQNQNETKKKKNVKYQEREIIQYSIEYSKRIFTFLQTKYTDKNSYSSAQTTKRRRYKATVITVSSNIQKVIFIFTFVISANSFHRRRLCSVIDVDVDSEEGGIELERPET